MFKNYVTTALRNLLKNRLFSVINIFGLALGFACAILIMLFVNSETGYDAEWTDADRLYRMHTSHTMADRPPFLTVRSAGKMMPTLSAEFPDKIEMGLRLMAIDMSLIRDDGNAFDERLMFADDTFFDAFDLDLLSGSAETALTNPLDVMISEEMAVKYFGRTDVIGDTLTICCMGGERMVAKVTAVFRDLPATTHLRLDFVTPIKESMWTNYPGMLDTYTSVNVYTYFKLQPGITARETEAAFADWLDKKSPINDIMQEGQKVTDMMSLSLMNIRDLHLGVSEQAGSMGDLSPLGDKSQIVTFTAIAALILAVASINFMNLSTARASRRAREVALRKVLGANRNQIIRQFLSEAIILSMIALVLGVSLVELTLPFYNTMLGTEMSFDLFGDQGLAAPLVLMTIGVGFVSGIYPAFVISKFYPAQVLKANGSSGSAGSDRLRQTLVVFQFAISIALAICTATIYGQTIYAQSIDTGFSYESKYVLSGISRSGVRDQQSALKRELERLPGVMSVTYSSEAPTQDNENNTFFKLLGDDSAAGADEDGVLLNLYSMDYDFFDAFDIEPLAGRVFDRAFSTDEATKPNEDELGSGGLILNESAMRNLGLASPEDAVGRVVRTDVFGVGECDLTIVGVVPDIYFRSIKFGKRASVYWLSPRTFRVATVTLDTDRALEIVPAIEATWNRIAPQVPYSGEFLDDMMRAQYATETLQAKLFAAFAGLAILIACLGLYGLASFAADRRTKEIGLRKVMGASVADILRLLVWQFSKPVLVANLIAWPVAWYLMIDWLAGFEYRIGINPLLFVGAGTIALAIAWATVAGHATRVARRNPIHALRYE